MEMAMEKKSRFSMACGLLSKMVKEKQQEISFDGTHRPPLTTVDLLSGIDVSGGGGGGDTTTDTETETGKPERLTIFYDGKMFVFDDIEEEKANALMSMASSCRPMAMTPPPPAKLNRSSMNLLAQTRKASLHRFLNKRKERINAMAPYQQTHAPASADDKMEEERRSWLALGHH